MSHATRDCWHCARLIELGARRGALGFWRLAAGIALDRAAFGFWVLAFGFWLLLFGEG
jgi:hypothetical protein